VQVKLFSNKKTAFLATGFYLLFLFGTLPLTPLWVKLISSFGYLTFLITLLLVSVIFFLLWGGYKSGRLKTVSCWLAFLAVFILYFGVASFTTSIVEKLHVWLYGAMGFFFFSLLRFWYHSFKLFLFVLLSVVLVGVTDESVQYLLPSRHFGVDDILFNFCGGLASLIVIRYVFGDDGKKI